jgi:type VI secretion system secreted protein VgrG
MQGGFHAYAAQVAPWLSFLARRSNSRIFQEMTAVEILERIFGEHGFSDYTISDVRESHPRCEFRVQYRETDLDFISRLMEDEGIFYFFRHERGSHTMVIADGATVHHDCSDEPIPIRGSTGAGTVTQGIRSWSQSNNPTPSGPSRRSSRPMRPVPWGTTRRSPSRTTAKSR